MPAEIDVRLPGDLSYLPLASRLVQEVGALPDGPGEEENEPLVKALETLLTAVLGNLAGENGGRGLKLTLSTTSGQIDLRVAVEDQGSPPLAGADDALAALDGLCDTLQTDIGDDGRLEIRLSASLAA